MKLQFRQRLVCFLTIHPFKGSAEWAKMRFHVINQGEKKTCLLLPSLLAYGTIQTHLRQDPVKTVSHGLFHSVTLFLWY